jgi:hypothetical protein
MGDLWNLVLRATSLEGAESPIFKEELNPPLPGREYFTTNAGANPEGKTHTLVARETTDDA